MGTKRKCSLCQKNGHNRRTCPQLDVEPEPEPEPQPKKKRKQVTCSVCGSPGHTQRTCKLKPDLSKPLGPTQMECGHWSWWKNQKGECAQCPNVQMD